MGELLIVLPLEWLEQRVDSLFEIQQGKQVSKKNRIGENQRYFLRTKNVYWGNIILDDLDSMNFTAFEEEKLKLEPGDLLVCEGGDIGRTAIWEAQIDNCFYQNHLHRLRVINGNASSKFGLYWFWYAFKISKIYFGRGNVTTIPNLSSSKLTELPIIVPPLPEQCKIASVLSTVQKAVEMQAKLIEHTTELKKVMMHKLFTEGTRGEKQKMTEIGSMPKSWKVVKLEPIVNFQTGKLNSNAAKVNGQYPFFTCSQETYWIDHYAFDTEAILLSGNNARAIYSVKYYKGKFNAYQRTYIITIKNIDNIVYLYLKHALTMKLEWLRNVSIGSQTKYLTLGILQNLEIPLPPVNEQQLIGNYIDSIDNKLEKYSIKKQKLEELFRTLLHQLMTAEIRVNDMDLSFLKEV